MSATQQLPTCTEAIVDGERVWVNVKNGEAQAELPPGKPTPKSADVIVPHPDKVLRGAGWRMAIFYLVLVAVSVYLLMPPA